MHNEPEAPFAIYRLDATSFWKLRRPQNAATQRSLRVASFGFGSARLGSARLDLTFCLLFGLGFCFLNSFSYVAFRLIVYSFVPSYASSARVDSIIIETNLNFYGHRDDMKEPLGLAGNCRRWGRGRYYVSWWKPAWKRQRRKTRRDETRRDKTIRDEICLCIFAFRMLSECPWTWRPKRHSLNRCLGTVRNVNWISAI